MNSFSNSDKVRFESKKDLWLSILLWLTIIICTTTILIISSSNQSFFFQFCFAILMLLVALFLLTIYFNTYYILNKKNIIIVSGFMKQVVELETITEMKKVTDVLSNPALSTKRVHIKHEKSNIGVQVSPVDRDAFIELVEKRIQIISNEKSDE